MVFSRTISQMHAVSRARQRAAMCVCVGATVASLAAARQGLIEPAVTRAMWPTASLSGAMANSQPPRGPAPRPRPTTVVTFDQGCSSARCHASINTYPVVHMPVAVMACQECHAPDAGNHTFPLLSTKALVCVSCHATPAGKKFQHQAMTEDGCLACHNPHGSSARGLLVEPTLQATCARCHPNAEGTSSHPPYATGRCDLCHDPHGGENQSLLIAGEGTSACVPCHAAAVKAVGLGPHDRTMRHQGSGVSQSSGADLLRRKSCTACHPPHAGSHDRLLDQTPKALCTSCHTQVGDASTKSRVTHDAVLKGDQCITCHDPHGSGRDHTLRDNQKTLCLSCHDKPVKARDGREVASMASLETAKVVHGAVREGDCSACHSVHGSEHERLLGQLDPGLLAGSHTAENYTLCFGCHDPALAKPGSATQFRDDRRNLHEVHLRPGSKQPGCASCHSVHASDLPRLIARSVNFQGSGWYMPMEFELTTDGGRCNTSCHEPLGYSRRPGGIRGRMNEGAP